MQFESEAQKACYEKVAPWIQGIFGEFAIPRQDVPAFNVYYGSGRTFVAVEAWGADDAVVTSIAWVAIDVDVTPELMKFLLLENVAMRFGAFGVDENGDVCFQHSIPGSSCTLEDLRASSRTVAVTVDQYDDQIVSRWGGRRAIDVLAR